MSTSIWDLTLNRDMELNIIIKFFFFQIVWKVGEFQNEIFVIAWFKIVIMTKYIRITDQTVFSVNNSGK